MREKAQDEPSNGFRAGSEVGGYRIGSRLGAGAMGAVYSAYDGGGNLVAMKFLHSHLDSDARGRERLRREANALQRLRHPAIAQILDVEFDGPEAFIVTELVEGPTLEDEIAGRGPLDAWDLYELADQLAAALEAVHRAGVVHRDLKPSNVLIAGRGPVIIDFGIAQGLDDPRVTATGLVMGTPGYLPPELLEGAQPSADTDWWGWAAVLAYAATGRAPFGVRPTEAVLARSRSGLPDVGGIGPTTAAALAGALRAEPSRRWGPTQVVAALRRAADEGDAPAPTIVVGPPASPTEVVAPVPSPPVPVSQRSVHDGRTLAVRTNVPTGPPPPAYSPGAAGVNATGAPSALGRSVTAAPAAQAYRRPLLPSRTPVVLTFALPAVLLACLYPVAALGVYAAFAFGARVVGVTVDTLYTRRERRGVSSRDAFRSIVSMPWYVLRALLGTIPSVLVGGCAGMLVVVGGWWALGPGGVDVPREGAELAVLAVAGVAAVAMVWVGPLTYLTRYGTRATLAAVAPGRIGGALIATVPLAAAGLLIWLLAGDNPVTWSPLPGPPQF